MADEKTLTSPPNTTGMPDALEQNVEIVDATVHKNGETERTSEGKTTDDQASKDQNPNAGLGNYFVRPHQDLNSPHLLKGRRESSHMGQSWTSS
jgi:hypothetical protein